MHAWIGPALPALVTLHAIAAFLFILVHGPSVYAMWTLRTERDPARVATLLDLSGSAILHTWIAVALLATTGAALAAATHAWREPWVWGSAILLVGVSASMSLMASRPFNHARHALGLRWFDGRRGQPATGLVDAPAVERALAMVRARAPATLAIGLIALAAMVWLMVARPG